MEKTSIGLMAMVTIMVMFLLSLSLTAKAQEYPKYITSNTLITTTDTLWVLTHSQYKTALEKIVSCNKIVLYQDSIIDKKNTIIINKNTILEEQANQLMIIQHKLHRSRWWNVGLGSGLLSTVSIFVAVLISQQ